MHVCERRGCWLQWDLVILNSQLRVPLHCFLHPDTFFIHEWTIHIPSVPALTLWGRCQSPRLMWWEWGVGGYAGGEKKRGESRKWKHRRASEERERRLGTDAELLGPFRKAHRTPVSCRAVATEERTSKAVENGMKREGISEWLNQGGGKSKNGGNGGVKGNWDYDRWLRKCLSERGEVCWRPL